MTHYRAEYNDGETAARRKVALACTPLGLRIETGERVLLAEWAWADVGLAEAVSPDRPIRLLNRAAEGARLAVDDRSILPILKQNAPHLDRHPVSHTDKRRFAIIGAVLAGLVLFVVYGLPRLAEPLAKAIPMDWEEQLGSDVITAVTTLLGTDGKFCTNPDGSAALQRLTDRLNATVKTPYRFKVRVIESDIVNAFAAPGGHVVMLSELIDKADTADEVAGVLAHEMGHVTERHPTKALIHAYGWSMLITALTGFSGSTSEIAASLALQLATASYSRENEAEADDVAVEILAAAGIGTEGFVAFFEKLQKKSGSGDVALLKYLASHPALHNRIEAVKTTSQPARGPAMSDRDWQALRNICN